MKLRDEQEYDMPLQQAISMVLERHPDLKYVYYYNKLPCDFLFSYESEIGQLQHNSLTDIDANF